MRLNKKSFVLLGIILLTILMVNGNNNIYSKWSRVISQNIDPNINIYVKPKESAFYELEIELSEVLNSFVGETMWDDSGTSIAGAGDVNNDGYDDFLIGAPFYNDGASDDVGKTYLFLGPRSGKLKLKEANASFIGESAADRSGYDVAGAGDVNNDGFDDFLIGTPLKDSGKVYLFYGRSANKFSLGMSLAQANASILGEGVTNYFGFCVAGAGDINDDGYDDIVVGANGFDGGGTDRGKVYVFLGPLIGSVDPTKANASLVGESDYDNLGHTVAGVGDVNGDDYDDFVISAPLYGSDVGKIYLCYGNASLAFGNINALPSFTGEAQDYRLGHDVAGAGDVNGDGLDDIIVSAIEYPSQNDYTGIVYLFYGVPFGPKNATDYYNTSFTGEKSNDNFGNGIDGAGDVNKDGFDDILIGAHYNDGGTSYLFCGPIADGSYQVSNANASFIGETAGDMSGRDVAGVGDTNNDGYDDFLIGAPAYNQGFVENIGKTYLIDMTAYKPGSVTLSSNGGAIDTDGKITLNWNSATYANSYAMYVQYLSEVGTPTQLLAEGLTTLSYEISGLKDGLYAFEIVAFNDFGNTTSNAKTFYVQITSGADVVNVYEEEDDDDDDDDDSDEVNSALIVTSIAAVGIASFVSALLIAYIIFKRRSVRRINDVPRKIAKR